MNNISDLFTDSFPLSPSDQAFSIEISGMRSGQTRSFYFGAMEVDPADIAASVARNQRKQSPRITRNRLSCGIFYIGFTLERPLDRPRTDVPLLQLCVGFTVDSTPEFQKSATDSLRKGVTKLMILDLISCDRLYTRRTCNSVLITGFAAGRKGDHLERPYDCLRQHSVPSKYQ